MITSHRPAMGWMGLFDSELEKHPHCGWTSFSLTYMQNFFLAFSLWHVWTCHISFCGSNMSLMIKVPSFCLNSNVKSKCTRIESKESPPDRSIESFTMHAGRESEKQKLYWRKNSQGMWRTVRKVPLGTTAKWRLKKSQDDWRRFLMIWKCD